MLKILTSYKFFLECYNPFCTDYKISFKGNHLVEIEDITKETISIEEWCKRKEKMKNRNLLQDFNKNCEKKVIGQTFKTRVRHSDEKNIYTFEYSSDPFLSGMSVVLHSPNGVHRLLLAKNFYSFSAAFDKHMLDDFKNTKN